VILINAFEEPGRNILPRGSDVAAGDLLVSSGSLLTPGRIGLLAAGGLDRVKVHRKPSVAIIATGDEVVLPGRPLAAGKLYASNLLTLNAWCRQYQWKTSLVIVPDDAAMIEDKLVQVIDSHDAVITSGGAWTGDRDLMAGILAALGWKKIYHRIRLRPGKSVGFGMLNQKPVFILPGGPPANLTCFLELVLPGLSKLSGYAKPGLQPMPAIMGESIQGRPNWTLAIFGLVEKSGGELLFRPDHSFSRLKSMADAQGILLLPEGVGRIRSGEKIYIQLLG